MYPNLRAEMARNNITQIEIANFLKKSASWVENRIQGKAFFDVRFCIMIRNEFFPKLDFSYLFATESDFQSVS